MPQREYNGKTEPHNGIDISPKNPKYGNGTAEIGGVGIGKIATPSLLGGVEKVYSPCDGKVTKLSLDLTGGGGFVMYIELFEKIDGKRVQLKFMHLNWGTKTNIKAGLTMTSFQKTLATLFTQGIILRTWVVQGRVLLVGRRKPVRRACIYTFK